MTIKTLFLTAAASAALALPAVASAQLVGDVGVGADIDVATPTDPVDEVVDQVDSTVDTVVDTAEDAADAADVEAQADVGAEAQADVAAGPVVAATSADVTAGATVRDTEGEMVGTVESVNANGAVVATGNSRVQIPVSSFGKNEEGLVLAMSKAELDAAAAAATPT